MRRSGVVHDLWAPIPREFDDYIARPKANSYRSLHTAVIGADGRALEVQIRTHEMHQHAELGVAAHWRYKEGKGAPQRKPIDDKIAWLRQVLAWRDEVAGVGGVGRAVEARRARRHGLRAHAAGPGHRPAARRDAGRLRLRGAHRPRPPLPRRQGRRRHGAARLPARQRPAGRDRRREGGRASRDWLNPSWATWRAIARADQGPAVVQRRRSTRARSRRAARRSSASSRARARRRQARGARGAVRLRQARRASSPRSAARRSTCAQLQVAVRGAGAGGSWCRRKRSSPKSKATPGASGILVVGVDRLMTQLARCCKPVPPDAIVGFVTRGKGITVHRRDCRSLAQLLVRAPRAR